MGGNLWLSLLADGAVERGDDELTPPKKQSLILCSLSSVSVSVRVIGGAVLYRATWGDNDTTRPAHDANCDDTTACLLRLRRKIECSAVESKWCLSC
jgi:hypothetical protein